MDDVQGRFRSVDKENYEGDLIPCTHRLYGLVWLNPGRVGGAPCFFGTRVPISTIFVYVAGGHGIDEFLVDFPPITVEEAGLVLRHAGAGLLASIDREFPGSVHEPFTIDLDAD